MNRTGIFLCAAGVLALVALVAGLPRVGRQTTNTTTTTVLAHPVNDSNGSLKMTGRLSHPYIPVGRSDVFITVDLAGVEVPGQERAPVNFATWAARDN